MSEATEAMGERGDGSVAATKATCKFCSEHERLLSGDGYCLRCRRLPRFVTEPTQHEAAIEAAAEASWRPGVPEDADWKLLTPGQQAMVREEWVAGKAAYDAARSGEAEGYSDTDVMRIIAFALRLGWNEGRKGEAIDHILQRQNEVIDGALRAEPRRYSAEPDGREAVSAADLAQAIDGVAPEPRQDQPVDRACKKCKGGGERIAAWREGYDAAANLIDVAAACTPGAAGRAIAGLSRTVAESRDELEARRGV